MMAFCIAKIWTACRSRGRRVWMLAAIVVGATACGQTLPLPEAAAAASAPAAEVLAPAGPVPAPASAAPLPAPVPARAAAWIPVPRSISRLYAPALGLVINDADPDSVAVGEYYVAARHLQPAQVLRVTLPIKNALSRDEFERLRAIIEVRFGPRIQALALAWTAPFAVECNSISGALALGFDAALCQNSCNRSRQSAYFNSSSSRPLTDHAMRPSMLLAAGSVAAAKAMIDRGVASDGTLSRTDRAPVSVMLLDTDDAARGVRSALYPPAGPLPGLGIEVLRVPESALASAKRVLMVTTGSATLNLSPPPDWVPGGLGDHLTSFGGDLSGGSGQSSALEWIASGATASHGAVSEPCNHLQKFPHPQVLLAHYVQGITAIEAYWKSVAWPQQSVFIGEPLAAPFGKY